MPRGKSEITAVAWSIDTLVNADLYDEQAIALAREWRKYLRRHPTGTLAEFARIFDKSVPTDFDQYWQHPTFMKFNYLLARAGAEPELPAGRLKSRVKKSHLPKEAISILSGNRSAVAKVWKGDPHHVGS